MYSIGSILKNIRENIGLNLQEVQQLSKIDITQLSRIENGKRLPTSEQLKKLSEIYNYDYKKLLVHRESDKIINSVEYPEIAEETLKVAETKLKYGQKYLSLFQNEIYQAPIPIESRRYIGSKAKLADWIMNIIDNETNNIKTFVDLFAGTGIIANKALNKYNKVIINDILYSNNVIYKGFFQHGIWDMNKLQDILLYYNGINPDKLTDNFFSENYGGKFFNYNVSKHIGYIREDIEEMKDKLTEKEYNILLATLIYNIDKLANTVGHFDAYIKKPINEQKLYMRLIDAKNFNNVEIYRKDANLLARSIKADIVYIDPPYNSRQYSRFYHLYETLIKWDKPQLYGVALKPKPDNMSLYCTTKARDVFEDLIANLQTQYIAVSYNNTYNSKSNSSENKIKLEEIENILKKCGETKVFECTHRFFNTGKTEFKNHKEFLFITKVHEKRKNISFPSLLRW
ncbi:MAG: adenine-specific DNA-methyltransferase [Rikenellaceae bacterium]|jgi:adenine-specific DNA-methyltransferase|nr:adenine-specific DNA-methyltransferase [Rikenellaceae bacterium]MDI3546236.1 adenine-specific DNA-methyltransferase [Rikenellaceae bacterium]MDN5355336.1 adenine-specific DNA-methyltransferase [Rikenellaceae bacterium]